MGFRCFFCFFFYYLKVFRLFDGDFLFFKG